MKKYICILFLISISKVTFCQDVIINGVNKNTLLTWDDFTGRPDRSSSHDANTYWNLNYTIKDISFKGDTAKIKGFSFKLELNDKLSWIKQGKQTNSLLNHEQGHFDIGLICQLDLIKQFNSTVFLKADFQNKLQTLFAAVLDKYRLLGIKYDEETDHSKNQQSQDRWNIFFAKELNK